MFASLVLIEFEPTTKFVIGVENDFRNHVCKKEELQDILPELQPLQKRNENNHC